MIFYGKSKILQTLSSLREKIRQNDPDALLLLPELLSYAARYGIDGNLWHGIIAAGMILDENPYTLACERKDRAEDLRPLAIRDFRELYQLYTFPFSESAFEKELKPLLSFTQKRMTTNQATQKIRDFVQTLDQCRSAAAFADAVTAFYLNHGAGKFGLYTAFYIDGNSESAKMMPIKRMEPTRLSDLWGYPEQKKQLTENTEGFLAGRGGNNTLLFGDSGTGKSTCVRALVTEYGEQGLRMVEITRHAFVHLKKIAEELSKRNYFFILYIDDLSFEEFEVEYKYFKAVIEGGLCPSPKNILIYATSNRRHIVKETYADKQQADQELHRSDSVQEKLSLADRFGLSICFIKPLQKDYYDIVKHLAKKAGITLEETELLNGARIWGLHKGGLSGRTARQYIAHLLGKSSEEPSGS